MIRSRLSSPLLRRTVPALAGVLLVLAPTAAEAAPAPGSTAGDSSLQDIPSLCTVAPRLPWLCA